jgi:sporulation protein YlmC with PRC-barrel domain
MVNVGDKVIIKDRKDWPSNPGYAFAGSVGKITLINEEEDFVTVHMENTNVVWAKDNIFIFPIDSVEKI